MEVVVEGNSFVQEGVWAAHDFPAEVDQSYPINQKEYQALKQRWIGTPVEARDPCVTDKLLRSWGLRSWKQYVLDQHLSNF